MTRAALFTIALVVCGLPPIALLLAATGGAPDGVGAIDLATAAFTLGLAAMAASVGGLLAIGPASVASRGGAGTLVVALAAMATLSLPEAATAYAIAEAWRQTLGAPEPLGLADHARAVLTVACGVWPIPAAAVAVAWARLPRGVMDAATLDGATKRTAARLAVGPWLAGVGGATLLAGRNVVAYDLTGIRTTGVLVRERFTTVAGDGRVASALAAAAPLAVSLAIVAIASWWVLSRGVSALRSGADSESGMLATREGRAWMPERKLRNRTRERFDRSFRSGVQSAVALPGVGSLLLTLPLAVLLVGGVAALARTAGGLGVADYAPQLLHAATLAALATAVAGLLLVFAVAGRSGAALAMAIAVHLVGGQLLALGLIALLADKPPVDAVATVQGVVYDAIYNEAIWFAWAPAALFAFLPLAAAAATWRGRLADLRDVAAIDGATPWRAALHVVLPLAWPGLAAPLAATFALSLGETHAAVLLAPDTLVVTMMGNVHTLAYGPMARAALLSATAAAIAGGVVVAVWRGGRRFVALAIVALLAVGCDGPADSPEAVWLDRGSGDGQIVYPRAICYSPADDALWVVDRTARVQKFDAATGEYLLGWPMPENQFGRPVGVSVDDAGNVWVPDTHYNRVIVYGPTGGELFRFGQYGEAAGDFIWPTDVLVLDERRVLVGEYGAGQTGNDDRIQLFERAGDDQWRATMQIGSFGSGPGQFRRPQSMARVGDELWVADAAGHRLLAFSLGDGDFGAFRREIGQGAASSEPGGFRYPYGLAADADGRLIVAEFGNNRVQVVDPATGESVAIWGAFGGRPGELKYPWAVAVDTKRDHAVVVDSGNDRLQIVTLP